MIAKKALKPARFTMSSITRTMLLAWALAFVLGAGLAAVARGDNEYWRCGPGPAVDGHVVAGGYEVTYIPPGAARLKVRHEHSNRDRHLIRFDAEAITLPLLIPITPGEYVSALATGKWTKEDPYPPLGCPTEPLLVPTS